MVSYQQRAGREAAMTAPSVDPRDEQLRADIKELVRGKNGLHIFRNHLLQTEDFLYELAKIIRGKA
jgi:hypothetical protein